MALVEGFFSYSMQGCCAVLPESERNGFAYATRKQGKENKVFSSFMMHLYINDCCLLSNRERSWLTQIKIYFWYSEEYRSKVDLAGLPISMFMSPSIAVWCHSQRDRKKNAD